MVKDSESKRESDAARESKRYGERSENESLTCGFNLFFSLSFLSLLAAQQHDAEPQAQAISHLHLTPRLRREFDAFSKRNEGRSGTRAAENVCEHNGAAHGNDTVALLFHNQAPAHPTNDGLEHLLGQEFANPVYGPMSTRTSFSAHGRRGHVVSPLAPAFRATGLVSEDAAGSGMPVFSRSPLPFDRFLLLDNRYCRSL